MKKTCAPPNFYDLRVSVRNQLSTSYKYKPFLMEQETNKQTKTLRRQMPESGQQSQTLLRKIPQRNNGP